jgi:hypothetical protein
VIHPRTDLAAVVRHAHANAMFLCEQCYLTSPAVQLTSQNATDPDSPCYVTHVRGWYGFFFWPRVPFKLKSADVVWVKKYDNKREKIEENF